MNLRVLVDDYIKRSSMPDNDENPNFDFLLHFMILHEDDENVELIDGINALRESLKSRIDCPRLIEVLVYEAGFQYIKHRRLAKGDYETVLPIEGTSDTEFMESLYERIFDGILDNFFLMTTYEVQNEISKNISDYLDDPVDSEDDLEKDIIINATTVFNATKKDVYESIDHYCEMTGSTNDLLANHMKEFVCEVFINGLFKCR